jgi:hypothetical protein
MFGNIFQTGDMVTDTGQVFYHPDAYPVPVGQIGKLPAEREKPDKKQSGKNEHKRKYKMHDVKKQHA